MRNYKIATIVIVFTTLCVNAFGQTNKNYFEFKKSGIGKQAMILIPGFACSGDVWEETIANFENDYTCYSLTMAGFAGVDPQMNSSFKNWTISIAEFIKANKMEKPIIIGHSMGGGLALAIAADYPDLIEKIIVIDALPCLYALTNPAFKANENIDCSASVNQIIAMTDDQFYQMQKLSISQILADSTVQEKVLNWSMKSDRKTFAEMYCNFLNTDLREKIRTIKCPNLILLESYFSYMKPAIEDQYKNLKSANLQYSNKGLHFIMYDDKEWYFSQINSFLAP